MTLFLVERVFKVRMTVLLPNIANSSTVESHFSDLVFHSRFTGLVTVSEQKHPVTVTAAKSIMSFWVLPVTVNLNGLAGVTETMKEP